MGSKLGPIAVLLFTHFSGTGKQSWGLGGSYAYYCSPSSPTLAVKLYSIGERQKNEGFAGLAEMYRTGFQNNPSMPAKVVKFCERIIANGDDDTQWAMRELAGILTNGAQGVDADPAQAVELLEGELAKKLGVSAMVDLADLLKDGADGVDANPKKGNAAL